MTPDEHPTHSPCINFFLYYLIFFYAESTVISIYVPKYRTILKLKPFSRHNNSTFNYTSHFSLGHHLAQHTRSFVNPWRKHEPFLYHVQHLHRNDTTYSCEPTTGGSTRQPCGFRAALSLTTRQTKTQGLETKQKTERTNSTSKLETGQSTSSLILCPLYYKY